MISYTYKSTKIGLQESYYVPAMNKTEQELMELTIKVEEIQQEKETLYRNLEDESSYFMDAEEAIA